MLAYILAVLVGTGSVGLYIAAFFFPEIHRKHDFIWSGVGFFYALTLWIYARQSMGGIVVGQTASVALLGWFAWQTLKLRRQLVPANQQTPLPDTSKIEQQLGLKPTTPTNPKATKLTSPPAPKVVEVKPSTVKPTVDAAPIPKAVEVKPSTVKPTVDAAPAQKAVEVKPSTVKPTVDAAPTPKAAEVKPSTVKPSVDTAPAPKTVEVKPSIVKPTVDTTPTPKAVEVKPSTVNTAPAPPIIPTPIEEEEKASITLQLEPPATAVKPLGQPVRPPAPPERPQQGILAAGAIDEVLTPPEDSSMDIDLELQSIQAIIATDENSKDESSSNWD